MYRMFENLDKSITLDKLNLTLLYAKSYTHMDEINYTPHTHPFLEIFYVSHGAGNFIFGNKTVPVRTGDVVMVNSKIKHTERFNHDTRFSFTVIGVEGFKLRKNLAKNTEDDNIENDSDFETTLQNNVFIKNFLDIGEDVGALFDMIVKEQLHQDLYHQKISKYLLESLVIILFRSSYKDFSLDSSQYSETQLEFVKNYLDSHYSHNFKLNDLANMVYLNKFYLVKQFKNKYGKSPINYLINKRINVAKDLLKDTDLMVKEVSFIVGFNSQSHFCKLFSQNTGLSPNQYRAKARP